MRPFKRAARVLGFGPRTGMRRLAQQLWATELKSSSKIGRLLLGGAKDNERYQQRRVSSSSARGSKTLTPMEGERRQSTGGRVDPWRRYS